MKVLRQTGIEEKESFVKLAFKITQPRNLSRGMHKSKRRAVAQRPRLSLIRGEINSRSLILTEPIWECFFLSKIRHF